MGPDQNELIRQRLLAIRREFRQLLEGPATQRPERNKAVFYSGMSRSLPDFCHWLGNKNAAFVGAKNLERLPAGEYLHRLRPELIRLFGTANFEERRTFRLPGGTSFSGSINGFWRDLSARYAKACSGVVHVLVAHDRVQLHKHSLEFWIRRGEVSRPPKDLRVFGFVEFPILVGVLSENRGVTAINIYIESAPGAFEPLGDGRMVVARPATA